MESTPDFNPFEYKPTISQSSKKLYTYNLVKLNAGKPIKNLNFLSKTEGILGVLEGQKPNTRRTYLIAILSSLAGRPEAKFKKLYTKYYPSLEQLNKDLKSNNTKTEKVENNWMEQSTITEKLEKLKEIIPEIKDKKKITPEQHQSLLRLVVLSLYTLQAPRRNMDYINMYVVKKAPDDTSKNYLDLSTHKFIFNNYKTAKTYKRQEVIISPELDEVLDVYLKFSKMVKPKEPMKLLPMTSSTEMTRTLNKILGKKVGCSMLRSIYLTAKHGPEQQALADDATKMGTSIQTIQDHYIKK